MIKILLILTFAFPSLAFAAITFDGSGKWETTFDCAPWEALLPNYSYPLSCDGIARGADNAGLVWAIAANANNPDGAGSLGARFWKGSGGDNINSGTASVAFPSPQRELWVRWYERYESGFSWGGSIDVKSLYFKGTNSNPYIGYQGADYRLYHANAGRYATSAEGGWTDVYQTGTSDGAWEVFEVHIKADTDGTDGVVQIWVGGDLLADYQNVDWGAGGASFAGWDSFEFLSNQKDPGLARAYYVDADDIAVYNQTPPTTDPVSGYPWIGPVSYTPPSVTCETSPTECSVVDGGTECTTAGWFWYNDQCNTLAEPSAPTPPNVPTRNTRIFLESFEDNDWSGRGWYDGTDSTGTSAGGYSGNALEWAWVTGATKPTGFSTIRQQMTSSLTEFMVEYFVKYESGWVGSGVNYHPHLLHIVSTEDWAETGYGSLAANHSNLYFESITTTSEPYTTTPAIQHQDSLRAASSANDLVGVTEVRSAAHCDTPYTYLDATLGVCYGDPGSYYSATVWQGSAEIIYDEWIRVTTYIKKNTFTNGVGNFDGVLKVWVGESYELAIDATSVLYATGEHSDTAWDKVAIAPYMQPGSGSPINQTMWIDELSVWTVAQPPSNGRAPFSAVSRARYSPTLYAPYAP